MRGPSLTPRPARLARSGRRRQGRGRPALLPMPAMPRPGSRGMPARAGKRDAARRELADALPGGRCFPAARLLELKLTDAGGTPARHRPLLTTSMFPLRHAARASRRCSASPSALQLRQGVRQRPSDKRRPSRSNGTTPSVNRPAVCDRGRARSARRPAVTGGPDGRVYAPRLRRVVLSTCRRCDPVAHESDLELVGSRRGRRAGRRGY